MRTHEPELDAIRRARARRARLTRPLLAVTACVGLVTVALFLVFPGFSPFRARTVAAPPPSAAPPSEPVVPVVVVHDGTIALDGVELGKTDGIDRLKRVDPLFEALKRRRFEAHEKWPNDPQLRLEIDVGNDVPAIVVKSVFQTCAFAGYTDVAFRLPDGGLLKR